jgi:hypothetical protein
VAQTKKLQSGSAKGHAIGAIGKKQILRFAQDDKTTSGDKSLSGDDILDNKSRQLALFI